MHEAGTRQAYIEVVAASDTANVDPSLVTLATSSYIGRNPLDTAGHASFESTYLYSSWDGNLEDGSQVRNGDYYIRIRYARRMLQLLVMFDCTARAELSRSPVTERQKMITSKLPLHAI